LKSKAIIVSKGQRWSRFKRYRTKMNL